MNLIKAYEGNGKNDIIKAFFNTTLKEVMSLLSADCGSLFLLDEGNHELVLDSFYNSHDLQVKGLRQRIGQGVAGKVADKRIPVLVKDINSDQRFRRNGFSHYHTNSFISIPLFSSERLLGVINIADRKDGKPFDEKDLNLAVFISRYACMAIDSINSYSRLKEEKKKLGEQKDLLEKYASMGKLAAGIVHEINNPLDGVTRYTNILLEQTEHNSVAREYLSEIKKGLVRIANITSSLLEFSHKVNSDSAGIKKYVDLHQLIDDSLDVLKLKISHNVRIDKKYSEKAPQIMDIGISHIFVNLIKNALDAMPGGGSLEIKTEADEFGIKISFKDSGSGIAEDIKNRIFDPFFTTKAIDKGTGFGLAICREVVNKYEGSIDVVSTPGNGSIFNIVIPRRYLQGA